MKMSDAFPATKKGGQLEVITEEAVLVEEIKEITSAGHEVTVESDDDYKMAGDFLNELKDKERAARSFFEPMVKAAHKAHKEVKARENEVVLPLVEAKKTLGAEMGRYQTKKEAERRAKEEKLRIQLQKEADERALVEAARLEEIGRVEKEARLEEAAKLEEAGKKDEAARMEAAARLEEAAWNKLSDKAMDDVPVTMPVIEPTTPKVEGTSVRTFWKYEIVDSSKVPREYMIVDEKAIGAMVRAKKGSTSIPGVRVYPETSVS